MDTLPSARSVVPADARFFSPTLKNGLTELTNENVIPQKGGEGVTVHRLTMRADTAIPSRLHRNRKKWYVLETDGDVVLHRWFGGVQYSRTKLSRGDQAFIPPNTPYSVHCQSTGNQKVVELLAVSFGYNQRDVVWESGADSLVRGLLP